MRYLLVVPGIRNVEDDCILCQGTSVLQDAGGDPIWNCEGRAVGERSVVVKHYGTNQLQMSSMT